MGLESGLELWLGLAMGLELGLELGLGSELGKGWNLGLGLGLGFELELGLELWLGLEYRLGLPPHPNPDGDRGPLTTQMHQTDRVNLVILASVQQVQQVGAESHRKASARVSSHRPFIAIFVFLKFHQCFIGCIRPQRQSESEPVGQFPDEKPAGVLTCLREVSQRGAQRRALQSVHRCVRVVEARPSQGAVHRLALHRTGAPYPSSCRTYSCQHAGTHHAFLLFKLGCRRRKTRWLDGSWESSVVPTAAAPDQQHSFHQQRCL